MTPNRRDFLMHTAGALMGFALLPELSFSAPVRTGAPRKIAVIGIGTQGRAILDELRKLDAVQVAAVCDTAPVRLKAATERAPTAEAFADFRELLARRTDVEAVLIATPTHLHR